jgi:hypothetical protein
MSRVAEVKGTVKTGLAASIPVGIWKEIILLEQVAEIFLEVPST